MPKNYFPAHFFPKKALVIKKSINIDELKPGHETDMLIAQALYRSCCNFSPSADLNDAFAAAWQAGLWKKYCLHWYEQKNVTPPDSSWAVSEIIDGEIYLHNTIAHDAIADDKSPAMAICKAILKLKENNERT